MKTEALVVLVFALAAIVGDCNPEVDVLTAWKSILVDPNSVLQSWDPTLPNPCTWLHITCNMNDTVVRVDLWNTNLSGPLSPQLGQLTNLQYLEVYGNKLGGAIPVQLANLTKLISLNLNHNQLRGVIPAVLGNLRSLRFLRLNSNKLSGTVPDTVIQLVTGGRLQLLNVSDNHLAGTVRATKGTGFAIATVIQDPKAPKHDN